MDDYRIEQYTEARKGNWDAFIEKARNATFLFKRDYMDYHADRFCDHSLMVYRKGKLYALLPANRQGDVLHSHQGLTYGGLVMSEKATAAGVTDAFRAIHERLKAEGIRKVVYKPLPCIYHRMPSQEDLYALFRLTNARIIGRNLSSTLCQESKLRFTESRKSGIRKALAHRIDIRQSDDYAAFWGILESNLLHKYGVKPVHSLEEIRLLAGRFPENIRLYLASQEGKPSEEQYFTSPDGWFTPNTSLPAPKARRRARSTSCSTRSSTGNMPACRCSISARPRKTWAATSTNPSSSKRKVSAGAAWCMIFTNTTSERLPPEHSPKSS